MILETTMGDVLLRHTNGRFALVRDNTVAPIAFRDGQIFAHSKRPADAEYLTKMSNAGWSPVALNTDIILIDTEVIWPVEPPPPPEDEEGEGE